MPFKLTLNSVVTYNFANYILDTVMYVSKLATIDSTCWR